MRWWIAEERWFPRPGELRQRAEALLPGSILRHDSYPVRVGLDRAVRLAIEQGAPLALQRNLDEHDRDLGR